MRTLDTEPWRQGMAWHRYGGHAGRRMVKTGGLPANAPPSSRSHFPQPPRATKVLLVAVEDTMNARQSW